MWQLVALLAYSEALTCPAYSCGSTTPTTGQCQVYTSSTGEASYKVTPCETGLMCPETASTSTTCQNYPAKTRYPGEYCQTDLDCMSLTCQGNVCQGLTTSSTTNCATTADCEPGLYCGSSKCVNQLALGSACTTDDQCTNDAYCDNKECVQMFSLSTGSETYTMMNSFAPLCMTGYAANVSNVWTCSVAPESTSLNGTTACPEVGDCVAKDGKTTKSCECGYSGKSYCPLFEGDSYVQSMISSWKLLFSVSKNSCNGLSRYSYACFYSIGGTSYLNYLNWALNASLYFDGTWYKDVNAPSCVQQTFLQDYYNLVYDDQYLSNGYSKCPVYEKAYGSSVWPVNQCVYYSNNIYSNTVSQIYQVGSCATGTCSTQMSANSTCSTVTSLRYPGEYCTVNSECYSGVCTSHKCIGQGLGSACGTNNLFCNPGFYCNSTNLCQSVNNTLGCTADSQCTTSFTCVLGKCVERYSLVDGTKSELTTGTLFGYSVGCQSGFAYKNTTTGNVICAHAPVSSGTSLPAMCLSGTTCKDSTGMYEESCVCGFSGSGYCPLFVGDKNYFTQAITYFKKISSKASCFNNQLTALCVMHDSTLLYDYYQYYVNTQNMLNAPAYHNAAEDILKIFENEYYTAVNYISDSSSSDSSDSSSFSVNLVAGSLALLFLA